MSGENCTRNCTCNTEKTTPWPVLQPAERNLDIRDSDPVDHPAHYTAGGIECIEAIQASMTPEGFIDYCKGNVMKYIWRAGRKGSAKQDLEKAEWYLNRMINEMGGKDE